MIEVGAWVLVVIVVCPLVMGVMMLVMWRGMRHDKGAARTMRHTDDRAPRDV